MHAVTAGGVGQEDMCDRSDKHSVLDYGTAAHSLHDTARLFQQFAVAHPYDQPLFVASVLSHRLDDVDVVRLGHAALHRSDNLRPARARFALSRNADSVSVLPEIFAVYADVGVVEVAAYRLAQTVYVRQQAARRTVYALGDALDLDIDPERVVWKRAMDMNDRALREIGVANGPKNGVPRKDGFIITVASELMAIMCLAKDENDFYERLRSIVVAYTRAGKEVTVADLKCSHAVMRLMKKALRPNLAQTLYGDPVFIHGGPFANIAHGCNSLIATKLALKLSPLVITEAGFAADLGAEKFLDIATREGGFKPNLVVVVATIRALKLHGGVKFEDLDKPNVEAMMKGIPNLLVHLENIRKFGMDSIVAINHFVTDAPEETASLEDFLREKNIRFAFVDAYERGAKGGVGLAHKVIEALGVNRSSYHPLYDLERPLKEKIETIAKEIYRADGVEYSELAEKQLADYEARGYGNFYVCMAKTPNSLSDDPKLLGVPEHHIVHIREVELAKGARFVIPLAGSILRMPGLPKVPAAIKMEDEPW